MTDRDSPDVCDVCETELDHRAECANVDCIEYERAVHGPIKYEVQFGWGTIYCATFERAADAARPGWCRVVRHGHAPIDEDDDGLTDTERLELTLALRSRPRSDGPALSPVPVVELRRASGE